MQKNTIQSISESTGYSVSTVSRVLSGKALKSRISQKTIDLIKAEAKRVNYTPNLLAQGLRTSRTHTIGLTVPDISNPFFALLASIVIENMKQVGYHTILADSMENEADFNNAIRTFRARNVDGIIAVPVGVSSKLLEETAESTPLVMIDRYFESTPLPFVCTDNYEGGKMATEYLLSRGYRNLLSIQGVPDSTPSKERVRGFMDAILSHRETGIEYSIAGDDFSVENGYREIMRLFKGTKSADAVFAYSSTILLGAIRAFQELGIKIPGEVAIISFDNNGFLDFLNPAVTRIEQPLEDIGRIATETILNQIGKTVDPAMPPVQKFIPPTLVVRNSC